MMAENIKNKQPIYKERSEEKAYEIKLYEVHKDDRAEIIISQRDDLKSGEIEYRAFEKKKCPYRLVACGTSVENIVTKKRLTSCQNYKSIAEIVKSLVYSNNTFRERE